MASYCCCTLQSNRRYYNPPHDNMEYENSNNIRETDSESHCLWSQQRLLQICTGIQFLTGIINFTTGFACIHSGCWGDFLGIGLWTGFAYIACGLLCLFALLRNTSSKVLLCIVFIATFVSLLLAVLDIGMNCVGLMTEVRFQFTFSRVYPGDFSKNWWLQKRCRVARHHIIIHTTTIVSALLYCFCTITQSVNMAQKFVKFAPESSSNSKATVSNRGISNNSIKVDRYSPVQNMDDESIVMDVITDYSKILINQSTNQSTQIGRQQPYDMMEESWSNFSPIKSVTADAGSESRSSVLYSNIPVVPVELRENGDESKDDQTDSQCESPIKTSIGTLVCRSPGSRSTVPRLTTSMAAGHFQSSPIRLSRRHFQGKQFQHFAFTAERTYNPSFISSGSSSKNSPAHSTPIRSPRYANV